LIILENGVLFISGNTVKSRLHGLLFRPPEPAQTMGPHERLGDLNLAIAINGTACNCPTFLAHPTRRSRLQSPPRSPFPSRVFPDADVFAL
jgi:hypothetical protein